MWRKYCQFINAQQTLEELEERKSIILEEVFWSAISRREGVDEDNYEQLLNEIDFEILSLTEEFMT